MTAIYILEVSPFLAVLIEVGQIACVHDLLVQFHEFVEEVSLHILVSLS